MSYRARTKSEPFPALTHHPTSEPHRCSPLSHCLFILLLYYVQNAFHRRFASPCSFGCSSCADRTTTRRTPWRLGRTQTWICSASSWHVAYPGIQLSLSCGRRIDPMWLSMRFLAPLGYSSCRNYGVVGRHDDYDCKVLGKANCKFHSFRVTAVLSRHYKSQVSPRLT
jgi:hypothetical protein